MRRVLVGFLIGALMFGSGAVGAKIATHDLNVNGTVHATGFAIGDQGLQTTLGGVDTNYVNVNNANGGVRWQAVQILAGDYNPNTPPALPCGPCGPSTAPVGSIFIGTGGLYRKTADATWTRLG